MPCPKGSSVLITKELGNRNLAYYSIYFVPNWRGAIYGTAKDAGSQSCVHALNALVALLGTGRRGYHNLASKIYQASQAIAAEIRTIPALKLIIDPNVNVVSFKVADTWIPTLSGSSYILAREMVKHGFILSTLSHNLLHFCVTMRFIQDPGNIAKFKKALQESIRIIYLKVQKGEPTESGSAGSYGSIHAAMNPTFGNSPGFKLVENFLLGPTGAKDAVRHHYLPML